VILHLASLVFAVPTTASPFLDLDHGGPTSITTFRGIVLIQDNDEKESR
jgi:hypothetical protein